jgi:hypothetical protein
MLSPCETYRRPPLAPRSPMGLSSLNPSYDPAQTRNVSQGGRIPPQQAAPGRVQLEQFLHQARLAAPASFGRKRSQRPSRLDFCGGEPFLICLAIVAALVGWVEPLRNPSLAVHQSMLMGFASLYPSYEVPSLRQVQPDMQFPQLLRRYLRGRTHQEVLGLLVHREHHHLAQVLLAA